MVFRGSGGASTLTKPKARVKFAEMKSLISSQMLKCFQTGLFQKPGALVSQQTYIDSLWSLINKGSYPEFIPEMTAGCLPLVLVLPRTFIDCKVQMEKIEKAMAGQVEFNEHNQTITVRIQERTIIFPKVEFSEWHTMISVDQPCRPYLLFGPINLKGLEKEFGKFSPEEILAIIFQCAA